MINPFLEKRITDQTDQALAKAAVLGGKKALEELILRHQAWIYNIALRMVFHPQEAEDVTQEILVKVITKLDTYQGRSKFRTWLYRIVANHVINMKKGRAERMHCSSFSEYWRAIERTPDLELPDEKALPLDSRLLVDEVRSCCMQGMLLCLDREQRLAFILGAIFEVSDRLGAEILELSRDNFRKRLSRARAQMHRFMDGRCGLMDPANPCSCRRKSQALVASGYVDPRNLLFTKEGRRTVAAAAPARLARFNELYDAKCRRLFRAQPFAQPSDFTVQLRNLVESSEFRQIFDLPKVEKTI